MSSSAQNHRIIAVLALCFSVSCIKMNKNDIQVVDGYMIPRHSSEDGGILPLDAVYKTREEGMESTFELNARYFYLQGEYLSRKNDLKGALVNLEKARHLREDEPQIYHSLSSVYQRLGKSVEAEALLRKTIELDPENVRAILDLAQILKTGENLDEVHKLFTKAVNLEPDSDEANLGLVILDIYNNKNNVARANLKKFLKTNPDSYIGYYYLASIEHKKGRTKAAEEAYKKSISLNPGYLRSGVSLGQLYVEQERFEELISLFESLSRYPGGEIFSRQLAEYFENQNDTEKAITSYEDYLSSVSDDPQAFLKLSFLYVRKAEHDKAEKTLKKLIELRPKFSSAYYLLGAVYEVKEKYKDALAQFKHVDWSSSFALEALKAKGRIHKKLNQFEKGWFEFQQALLDVEKSADVSKDEVLVEAITYLSRFEKYDLAKEWSKKSLDESPDSEALQYVRAFVYEESGESVKAAQDLDAFIVRTKSSNPSLLNFVGYVYAENDMKLDLAERYIRKALKLKKDDPYITDSLGWVLYKKKDYKSAETFLRKALKAAPEEVVILEHLADCLVKLGSLQEANELYVKAAKIGHEKPSEQKKLEAKMARTKQQLNAQCAIAANCDGLREQRAPAAKTD